MAKPSDIFFRNVCFTVHDPSNEIYDKLKDLIPDVCNYIVFQEETGNETHKKHLQGYCEFINKIRLSAVKKHLGNTTHIEARKGSQAEAIAYCKKEDTRTGNIFEYGNIKKQGKRTDLETFTKDVLSGADNLDLIENHVKIMCQYPKFAETIRTAKAERIAKETDASNKEVSIFWGKTGTGKSFKVHQLERPEDLYIFPEQHGNTIWIDGYKSQPAVLIDEFYGNIKISAMLTLLDVYKPTFQVKGGTAVWCPKRIYICSNTHPKDWYRNQNIPSEVLKAFHRRIKNIYEFKTLGETPTLEIKETATKTD